MTDIPKLYIKPIRQQQQPIQSYSNKHSDTSNTGILLLGAAAIGLALCKSKQQQTSQQTQQQNMVHPTIPTITHPTTPEESITSPLTSEGVEEESTKQPLTSEEEMKKFVMMQGQQKKMLKTMEEKMKKQSGFQTETINRTPSILPLKDRLENPDTIRKKFGFASESGTS